ncbi:hypothetical protein LNTAR_04441 [Lentisphaera araneosa HTCC2155]|uniref:Uncharacterized protein n=1 Tax=Lentisphaera araneosa HTCC2155 TaxID=313628 RepID=A6DQI7_9BACT|nr:cell envelope integrity protein TolA [Lentisphaera araneosa]EDM26068.1 hypothetical protein LNTAR_04441 [Lentisphaera araneosa HTCC2155]
MKVFLVSIVLHIIVLGLIYLNGGFEPVESSENRRVNPQEVAPEVKAREKSVPIKDSKKRVLDEKEKEELIVKTLDNQKKQYDRMTPSQKHRSLDHQLDQLDGVDGGILEVVTLEVLKLMDSKEPSMESKGLSKKTGFDHESSFFKDVAPCPTGIQVSMEDKHGNKSSYIIDKKDVTEDDLALLKLYQKSKNNKALKIILDSFIKHYQNK